MTKATRLRAVLAATAVAGVVLVGFSAARMRSLRQPAFHGTAQEQVLPATDFSLVDHEGRPVTLASYRGKAVLLFFGYTHCPDVCPLTLARLSGVLAGMGDDADGVRVLLVTLDPARDTPPVLAAYAKRFGPQVVGLTGDSASLEAVKHGYGAYTMPASEGMPGHGGTHGQMGHSSAVYGIDREGRLRVIISDMATTAETRDDVRTLAGL
ncbi:MAG TPA: SCO family protein [Longimicrobiaceae bacterium]|jgi:protein SCO1/2|nr:SCO family protein [Longimicrobiaceae bacterium]